jgi:hypothetical protein
VFEGEWKQNKI